MYLKTQAPPAYSSLEAKNKLKWPTWPLPSTCDRSWKSLPWTWNCTYIPWCLATTWASPTPSTICHSSWPSGLMLDSQNGNQKSNSKETLSPMIIFASLLCHTKWPNIITMMHQIYNKTKLSLGFDLNNPTQQKQLITSRSTAKLGQTPPSHQGEKGPWCGSPPSA